MLAKYIPGRIQCKKAAGCVCVCVSFNLKRAAKFAVSQSGCASAFHPFSLPLPPLLDIMHIDSVIANILAMVFIKVASSTNLNYQTENMRGRLIRWNYEESGRRNTGSLHPNRAARSTHSLPFSLQTGKLAGRVISTTWNLTHDWLNDNTVWLDTRTDWHEKDACWLRK